MDLAAWLLEQYVVDEQIAGDPAIDQTRKGEPYSDNSGIAPYDNYPSYPWGMEDAELRFMERFHPLTVLADLAAKRQILALHPTEVSKGYQTTDGWYTPKPYCACQTEDGMIFDHEPCETKRLLALPYADREGYREEWRPQG